MTQSIPIGTVTQLHRFPVKSMRGQQVDAARLYWHGLDGDRRYAFVRGDIGSGFPWLTGRQIPQMLAYTPRFTFPDDPVNSPVEVQTPNGRSLPITDPTLLAELAAAYGGDVSLIKIGRGIFDSQVLSVIGSATLAALSEMAGVAATARRFRQNIVIDTDTAFAEEGWLDGVLTFGSADGPRIRLNRRIQRCVMVNIDPETAVSHPAMLKTVAQQRDNCLGVYASTEQPGVVHVGDEVRLMIND